MPILKCKENKSVHACMCINDEKTIHYIIWHNIELYYHLKHFLIVAYSINKFSHYNTRYPILFHTCHATIRHLMNKNYINGRKSRWLLLIKGFYLTILDKLGKHNVIANFLYILTNITNHNVIDDNFPNGDLF